MIVPLESLTGGGVSQPSSCEPGSTFSPARHGVESFRELAEIGLLLRQAARTATVIPITAPLASSLTLSDPPIADLALDA